MTYIFILTYISLVFMASGVISNFDMKTPVGLPTNRSTAAY